MTVGTVSESLMRIGWVTATGEQSIYVREGDVYEFDVNVSTRAGHTLQKGDRLTVLRRTTETPHNEIGPRGCNWVCRTFYGDTVWATLEQCLDRGLLHIVGDQRPNADVVRH